MKVDFDVLIVGAGPTGLVLACELARRGVSHRLIDRGTGSANGSRGKGTQPRSLEIFDDLGIVDRVIAGGRFNMPMVFHGAGNDEAPVKMHAGPDHRPDAPYAVTLLTPQWHVEETLRARLGELGGMVTASTWLIDLVEKDDGVAARVRTAGRDETIRARWVVGCDGGHSRVRERLGIPFIGETYEKIRMWVGDVHVSGLDRDHWHVWRSDNAMLALCPLPATDQFQFQATISESETREPSIAAFQELVTARTGRDDIHLARPGWTSCWRANVRMVDRYRVGRVFLAGDAAHVHSPAGGQGMNTGIQDAYNLGWKLAAVIDGADAALLDTYQEERLPIAAWVLGVSSALSEKPFDPGTKRDATTLQLDLDYRGARLSIDERSHLAGIRAGDRAPDAPGLLGPGGTKRLFDLMRGPQVTVLAFDTDLPQAHRDALARFADGVRIIRIERPDAVSAEAWIDSEGYAHRLYAAEPGTLFVIRPDGYVGLVASTPSCAGLFDYLERLVGRPGRHDRQRAA